jgi:hypothetical protein
MFLGSASEVWAVRSRYAGYRRTRARDRVRAASINCDRAFITFRYNFNKRPQFNYALKIGLSVA